MAELGRRAIGAPPLLIDAIDIYHRTATFFSASKEYPRKLRQAIEMLRIQELCFRKANEKALGFYVTISQAREMLHDPSHPTWRVQTFLDRYLELLGNDRLGFEAAIVLICNELNKIQAAFDRLIPQQQTSSKATRKLIRLAFEQSGIADYVRDLSAKTQKFIALINLTTVQPPSYDAAQTRSTSHVLRTGSHLLSTVKAVAEEMYVVLRAGSEDLPTALIRHPSIPVRLDLQQIFTPVLSQLTGNAQRSRSRSSPPWVMIKSSLASKNHIPPAEASGSCQIVTATGKDSVCFQDESSRKAIKARRSTLFRRSWKSRISAKVVSPSRFPVTDTNTNTDTDKSTDTPHAVVKSLINNSKASPRLHKFIGPKRPDTYQVSHPSKSGHSQHLVTWSISTVGS
jgi:hypothetical protein